MRFLLCWLIAFAAALQSLGAQHAGGSLRGVVWDSLRAKPLAGAIVQLAPTASGPGLSAIADSSGVFLVTGARGRYLIGFIHPLLDSLGVDAPVREIEIGSTPATVTLSTPGTERLREAVCGKNANADLSALVMGVLRTAPGGVPLDGGRVTVAWGEVTIGLGGATTRMVTREATARADGIFAVCDVPSATLRIAAHAAADSTDWIELIMPPTGFTKIDLHVGTGASRTASGRLTGMVKDNQGTALADARVSHDSLSAYSDAQGHWTLSGIGFGTRTITVRRLGYFPHDVSVAVGVDTTPLAIALTRVGAFLDTFRVVARMDHIIAEREFEARRHVGHGRYLAKADIDRLRPSRASDLFFRLGLRVVADTSVRAGHSYHEMRGPFGACRPEFYLNGVFLGDSLSTWEIDGVVSAKHIVGMELHGPETVPPQYHRGLKECGSLLIWSREY